jgi:hypothetical protein
MLLVVELKIEKEAGEKAPPRRSVLAHGPGSFAPPISKVILAKELSKVK